MDQTSQAHRDIEIEHQIRECFARVVYSHKTHEKQAEITARWFARLQIFQISLGALTSSGLLAAILFNELYLQVGTAVLSLLSLFVSGYMKGNDLGAQSQRHRDTAADLWSIRESYLSLLVDYTSKNIDLQETRARRDDLQEQLGTIYKSAPGTTEKAYKLAQTALKSQEDYTFNEGEIDKFLPASLRNN